jgi:hypothetical protein
MTKVTKLVLMLCLILSGALCHANGVAGQENKKVLFLLLVMLAGMAKAQHPFGREYDWDDLATENRAWVQMYRSDYQDTIYYQLGIKGDTLVNGLEYKKLIECSHLGLPIEGQCVGGIRKDGDGKYYFVSLPPFLPEIGCLFICPDDQEVLLYDFSLSVWDEWQDPCYTSHYDIVSEVGEEEFCGIMRKVIVMNWDPYAQWIGGIGSNEGLLYPIYVEIPLSGIAHRTVEVFQDGRSIYKNPEFEGIDYTEVSEWHEAENVLSLYPNPAKEQLLIQFSPDVQPKQIELYDLQGRLVRTQSKAFESIDMSQLPAGTYTLRVTLEDGQTFSDKVVKE